ncbi:MAG: glycoside hydrolase family 2 protein [Conexibacter sp.]|nr:glycoside hydrolase family 2 protein [Conexibacter sp.]
MPRWPEHAGLEVARLDGFVADGPPGDERDCVFTLEFSAVAAGADEEVALAFDGIATEFEVVLNGVGIATGSSMFAAFEVDVGAVLRDGANVLEIRCRALRDVLAEAPRRPRQRWRTKVVADGALRFVRTAVIGRAPGFAAGPPIVGPWRPVWLVRRRGVAVQDVALRPRLEGDEGVLDVRLALRAVGGAGDGALPRRVEVVVGAHRCALAVGADGTVAGELRLPGVERWWPHTHGAPVLHDVTLVLDGERAVALGRTGFRALTPGPDHDVDRDGLALAVNGVPVFARGAVWTPVAEGALRATLTTMRDGGMNLVRVAGIGVYEDAAFHDLCDELGLLVWQDFMFANLDYPIADAGFRAAVEAEARAALAEVAGRPSLAVLCGNSEVEQQAAMFGVDPALGRGELFGELLPRLARESGADVPYVPSAPCGGALPFHPGSGVANYFGVGGYRRPLDDARRAEVRFASECLAFANLPDGPVADGEGVMRDVGADWDFADVRDHYLREVYGIDAAALRDGDRERYLALGRQVTGEVMAATFGEWRRAASPTAGAIVLWLRDVAPGAGWGVLDHRGAPKVAFAHLRRALAPRAVWIVDEGLNGLDVHVANDGPGPLVAELHVALLAGGAHTIAEGATALTIPPHATACHNAEGLLGHFADASCAYRFGPPAHDTVVATLRTTDGTPLAQATHFPTGPPLQPTTFTLTAIVKAPDPFLQPHCEKGDSPHPPTLWGQSPPRDVLGTVPTPRRFGDSPQVVVALATERVAWGVRISAPGFVPVDDAFDLVPGGERLVALRPVGNAVWAGGAVTALNLIGEAPIARADVRD